VNLDLLVGSRTPLEHARALIVPARAAHQQSAQGSARRMKAPADRRRIACEAIRFLWR